MQVCSGGVPLDPRCEGPGRAHSARAPVCACPPGPVIPVRQARVTGQRRLSALTPFNDMHVGPHALECFRVLLDLSPQVRLSP